MADEQIAEGDGQQSTTKTNAEGNIIQDESFYSPKSEFNKAMHVSVALSRAMLLRAKEMRSGFWSEKQDKFGNMAILWNADSRLEYIASVDALLTLLRPELEKKACITHLKALADLYDELKEAWEIYAYEEISPNDTGGFKKTGSKLMPPIGSPVYLVDLSNPTMVIEVKGGWDGKINNYLDSKLEIYDDILAELNKLIDRLDYFRPGIKIRGEDTDEPSGTAV